MLLKANERKQKQKMLAVESDSGKARVVVCVKAGLGVVEISRSWTIAALHELEEEERLATGRFLYEGVQWEGCFAVDCGCQHQSTPDVKRCPGLAMHAESTEQRAIREDDVQPSLAAKYRQNRWSASVCLLNSHHGPYQRL